MEIRIQIDAMEDLTEKLENACHIKNALLRGGEIARPSYAKLLCCNCRFNTFM